MASKPGRADGRDGTRRLIRKSSKKEEIQTNTVTDEHVREEKKDRITVKVKVRIEGET